MRRNDDIVAKQAQQWIPQGNRDRGRPKNTWSRDLAQLSKTAGGRWWQHRTELDGEKWPVFHLE